MTSSLAAGLLLTIAPLTIAQNSPAASATFKRVSELRCAQNANLMTGLTAAGAPATDAAACINGYLATASAEHPVYLVQDGRSLVSGISGPAGGYWTVDCLSPANGFFLKAGSNAHLLSNGLTVKDATDPGGVAPPRTGQYISIRNCFLNGNRGDGHTGNSTTGDPRGAGPYPSWLYGIYLRSAEHILIDNVRTFNISSFNVMLSNVDDVVVRDSHFENDPATAAVGAENTDGVHFDGPSEDIRIEGNKFRTGDDSIALNAFEGYGGPIQRVTITGNVMVQSQTCLRAYTGGHSAKIFIDKVVATGNTCTANLAGVLLGLEFGGLTQASTITNFQWGTSTISAPEAFVLMESVGNLSVSDTTWGGDAGIPNAPHPQGGFFNVGPNAISVDSLSCHNCTAVRTPAFPVAHSIIDGVDGFQGWGTGTAHFGRVEVSGFKVIDEPFGTTSSVFKSELLHLGESTITSLHLADVDPANITGLADNPAHIGSISGPGLLPSGWSVPSARVADGTPFLDVATGFPSINVAGQTKVLAH